MMRIRMTSFTANVTELGGKLHSKLEEVAAKGNGKVPLHGRLFAQWLHYAFPNECPYPHAAGSVRPRTQGERIAQGEDIFIDPEDVEKHLQQGESSEVPPEGGEEELWSWDEELMHAPEPSASNKR